MQVEPRCGFCYQRSKIAEHVLWTCPFARNVWALCRGKIQKCSNAATDFFSLFRLMVDRLSSNELEKWATMSWALWTARNKFYLEKIQWHPIRILGEALGLVTYWSTKDCVLHRDMLVLFSLADTRNWFYLV